MRKFFAFAALFALSIAPAAAQTVPLEIAKVEAAVASLKAVAATPAPAPSTGTPAFDATAVDDFLDITANQGATRQISLVAPKPCTAPPARVGSLDLSRVGDCILNYRPKPGFIGADFALLKSATGRVTIYRVWVR